MTSKLKRLIQALPDNVKRIVALARTTEREMKRPIQALLALASLGLTGGCRSFDHAGSDIPRMASMEMPATAQTRTQDQKQNQKLGSHQTAHAGVLNAIVKCEIGHAEAKREGDTLHVWFVGGAPDTTKAVPIPDRTVILKIVAPTIQQPRRLVLKPEPLDLAGETIGNCSRFTGTAAWLQGMDRFTATATITFKGQKQPLRIEYPDGYDPD
jgi:hypothetical protein